MRIAVATLLLVSAAAAVSGCGFHLQGRAEYGPEFETVYLQVPDNGTELARELRRSLEVAGVNLTPAPEKATAILHVVGDDTGRDVESVDAQNRPREYRIFYRVSYRVVADGKVVLDNQRVVRTRVYTYDELEVLAKAHEERQLRTALAKEIAGVITRRLSNIEVPAS